MFEVNMDFPLIFSTFFTVFLAELGDKTQLATVAMSGSSKKPLAVFVGSSTALVFACLIAVLAGGSLSSFIKSEYLQLLASVGFLIIGLRLIIPNINFIHNSDKEH